MHDLFLVLLIFLGLMLAFGAAWIEDWFKKK